jgi:hypothetical protein
MSTATLIWIVVAVVVVVAAVVAAVALGRRQRVNRDRTRAEELRQQADSQASGLARHTALADETEASAAAARAEAERKQAEAARLEAEANDRRSTLEEHRSMHEETLRRADEIDPDAEAPAEEPDTETESQR